MTTTSADAAFTEFVDANHAYLSRAAYLMTSDRTVAEDLLQEALVRTYRAWRRVEPGMERLRPPGDDEPDHRPLAAPALRGAQPG